MKIVRIPLMERATFLFMVCAWASCSMLSKTPNKKVYTEPMSVLYVRDPVIKVVHDTIPQKRDPAALQEYLNKQYQINADKFITPQFDKLTLIIDKQADALNGFKDMLTDMRMRSIKRADSVNNIIAKDKKDYARLEQVYFEEQKKQVTRNAIQINNLKAITNILLCLGAIMVMAILGLTAVARVLWNRMNRIYKDFANV